MKESITPISALLSPLSTDCLIEELSRREGVEIKSEDCEIDECCPLCLSYIMVGCRCKKYGPPKYAKCNDWEPSREGKYFELKIKNYIEPKTILRIRLEDGQGILALEGWIELTPSDFQELIEKTVNPKDMGKQPRDSKTPTDRDE